MLEQEGGSSQVKPMAKLRLFYLSLFLLLLAVEAFIAVFIHDAFVRPFLGDVLAVIVVYCFVRIFIPKKVALLPLYVFLFAAAVEFAQLFHLATLLGLRGRFFRVIFGSSFDGIDLLCYLAGGILLAGWEIWRKRR